MMIVSAKDEVRGLGLIFLFIFFLFFLRGVSENYVACRSTYPKSPQRPIRHVACPTPHFGVSCRVGVSDRVGHTDSAGFAVSV